MVVCVQWVCNSQHVIIITQDQILRVPTRYGTIVWFATNLKLYTLNPKVFYKKKIIYIYPVVIAANNKLKKSGKAISLSWANSLVDAPWFAQVGTLKTFLCNNPISCIGQMMIISHNRFASLIAHVPSFGMHKLNASRPTAQQGFLIPIFCKPKLCQISEYHI